MRKTVGGVIVAASILFLFPTVHALAGPKSDWVVQREQKFTQWRARRAATETASGRISVSLTGRHRTEIWDDPVAPRLIVLPAGDFVMGAPRSEPGSLDAERPQHRVRIGYSLAVGKFDVTRGEFAEFVAEAKYHTGRDGCVGFTGKSFETNNAYNWKNPGFPQTDDHPVVCVSWQDANAYATWLSRKTGKPYRLLSEAEWEYAARGGRRTPYWWGKRIETGCAFANMADLRAKRVFPWWGVSNCDDRYVFTSPVGAYAPNPAGLYDISGNAWQWVLDCWNRDYAHAPANGAAWQAGNCTQHIIRGGAWNDRPRGVRLAYRAKAHADVRGAGIGFRIARALVGSDAIQTPAWPEAKKSTRFDGQLVLTDRHGNPG